MRRAAKNFFPDFSLLQRLQDIFWEAEEDLKIWEAAKEAESSIKSTISRVGHSASESDKDKLERAMSTYQNLSLAQQSYVSKDVIRKLDELLQQAKDDEDKNRCRREEELLHRKAISSEFGRSTGGGGRSSGSTGASKTTGSTKASRPGGGSFGGGRSMGGAGRRK